MSYLSVAVLSNGISESEHRATRSKKSATKPTLRAVVIWHDSFPAVIFRGLVCSSLGEALEGLLSEVAIRLRNVVDGDFLKMKSRGLIGNRGDNKPRGQFTGRPSNGCVPDSPPAHTFPDQYRDSTRAAWASKTDDNLPGHLDVSRGLLPAFGPARPGTSTASGGPNLFPGSPPPIMRMDIPASIGSTLLPGNTPPNNTRSDGPTYLTFEVMSGPKISSGHMGTALPAADAGTSKMDDDTPRHPSNYATSMALQANRGTMGSKTDGDAPSGTATAGGEPSKTYGQTPSIPSDWKREDAE